MLNIIVNSPSNAIFDESVAICLLDIIATLLTRTAYKTRTTICYRIVIPKLK